MRIPRTMISCLLGVTLACAAAQAADYRWELGVTADHLSIDADDSPDVDAIGAFGTFYLEPVPTDGLPLAEAAFLNRSSYLGAAIEHLEADDEDLDAFGASFGYYVPDTIFFGRIGVTKTDGLGPGDDTDVNGTFGVTPIDGLLVSTDFNEDGWDPNATAKYVGTIANRNYYAASVSVVDPDEGDVDVGVDFDYFLDLTFSVGAGLSSASDGWRIRAEKFFTPGFAVGGRVYGGDGGDGLGATVRWRF